MENEIERREDAQVIEISEEELEETMKNFPDMLTEEERYKLSFSPALMKDDDGYVVIIPMADVVRIPNKEAAKRLYGLILGMFDQSDCEKGAQNAHQD